MAIAIVATVGSATANSFVTEAEADTYLEARSNVGAWDDDSDAGRIIALIEATRELNYLPWMGSRTDSTQILSWPRENVVDPDSPLADPIADYPYYTKTVIPQRVKDAQVELALEFLRAGSTDISVVDPTLGIKSEKIDVITTDYENSMMRPTGLGKYPRIIRLIAPLLDGVGSVVRA